MGILRRLYPTVWLLVLVAFSACERSRTTFEFPVSDTSWEHPPEAAFSSSDYVFKLNQLTSFYDVPGEYGYLMEGEQYGFSSLSLIITETHPGGGPPLHTHESEEAHVLLEGHVAYVNGDSTFTVEGPYILKVPAGVPHTFVNTGDAPFNIVAVFPSNRFSYKELGPNPLVKKRSASTVAEEGLPLEPVPLTTYPGIEGQPTFSKTDLTRKDWEERALRAANIDIKSWDPSKGFAHNKETLQRVYAFYATLYNRNSNLRWAGMAKLAGGEVYRALQDELQPIITAAKIENKSPFGPDPLGGRASRAAMNFNVGYAKGLQVKLLEMQKDIFHDLAWQHQAFVEGGLSALETANKRRELSNELLQAWRYIASGNEMKVRSGSYALLRREQFEILQGGAADKGHYRQIRDIPDFDQIIRMMSDKALSPIPGGTLFKKVVPGGDITIFNDRWSWITKDMIPAFERLSPSYLKQLVNLPLEHLARRKFPTPPK